MGGAHVHLHVWEVEVEDIPFLDGNPPPKLHLDRIPYHSLLIFIKYM